VRKSSWRCGFQTANNSSSAVEFVRPRVISKQVTIDSFRFETISFDRQHAGLKDVRGCC
jgi:hypothetical protein